MKIIDVDKVTLEQNKSIAAQKSKDEWAAKREYLTKVLEWRPTSLGAFFKFSGPDYIIEQVKRSMK